MVKGVNKTVIEVNDTGSKMFEKVVFFVSPKYGNLKAASLNKAVREFSFNMENNLSSKKSLRKRVRLKRGAKIFLITAGLVLAAGIALLIIL
ncbi:MAG: hypothetical protein IJZ75_07155 [Clostridia bacterium]|nr:hypothetical protein [Clostridia bacterium]